MKTLDHQIEQTVILYKTMLRKNGYDMRKRYGYMHTQAILELLAPYENSVPCNRLAKRVLINALNKKAPHSIETLTTIDANNIECTATDETLNAATVALHALTHYPS